MTRIRAALCLLVVVALCAPAASNAATARRTFEQAAAHTTWQRASAKTKTGHELLAAAARSHQRITLDRLIDLQQQALSDPISQGGSGLHPLLPADVRARATRASGPVPSPGGTFMSLPVLPLDANGDGLSDVLVAEYDPSSVSPALNLVLRAGSDGHELWHVSTSPFASVLLADLDGDGHPELVVFDVTMLAGHGRFGRVAYAIVQKIAQTIAVLNAATGTPISSTTFTEHVISAGADGLLGGAQIEAVTGLVDSLDPFAAGNATSDLLATTVNYVFTDTFLPVAFGIASVYRESAIRVSRTNGAQTKGLTVTGLGGFACVVITCNEIPVNGRAIFAAPDIDGDHVGDLLVAGRKSVAIESFDGKTTVWKASTGTYPFGQFAQLNGTGPQDLIVYSASGVAGLDGATGTSMWSFDDPNLWSLQVVADTSGDGGSDLFLVDTVYDLDFNETDTALMRSGADGSELWSRAITPVASDPAGTAFLAQCWCASDLNGDGAPDDMFAAIQYDADGNYVSADVFALSGHDGARLWTWSAFPGDYSLPVPAGGDVNGDGTPDLVEVQYLADNQLTGRLSSGSDAAPLWSAPLTVDDLSAYSDVFTGAYGFAANLLPGGADEMVFGTNAFACNDTGCVELAHTHGVSPAGEFWVA